MQIRRKSMFLTWELALWSTIAVLLAVWSASIVRNRATAMDVKGGSKSDTRYTWVGDDYPAYYPMEVQNVIMFPEDMVHYPIDGDDALEQWETQFPTHGDGWVCLGPERSNFALTMYHKLHCLGRLRLALEQGANRTYEVHAEHVQHCLNYLRMMTLCRADVTLEPVLDSHLTVDLTQPHLCRDWTQVYKEAERNVEQCRKQGT
ncbi:hypothetical protein JVU11DRAFT_10594 [Chiua virens]|nr:hypothetical protein JVU11DRAFT_10594 [Chiua virens]